jgi:peptidoglycan/LPS O-acetylase OafA/YrhL
MPETLSATTDPLAARSALTRSAPPREFYLDRLRAVMTALVVLHHTAITYGAPGSWYYNELYPSDSLTCHLLTFFVATNQAYFMGFFFLLAGYFTPSSLERKGYARFIGDRFLRLGLPLLFYIVVLNPLTDSLVAFARGHGFWASVAWHWDHAVIGAGPMWFVQALLMFTLAYCAWRAIARPSLRKQPAASPVPSSLWWLLSAIAVGAAALAIRQFVPTGVNVVGLQLGYFASYVFLFAVGIAARRHDWLNQLQWRQARWWIRSLAITGPALPVGIALSGTTHGARANFSGGYSWPAILYAFWEPFVAWGLIAAWLLFMRKFGNAPSALWSWLNRRAYAVYIIHPPVLVGIAVLLHGWTAPALLKFGVTGTLACAGCWLIADPLVRLPGLRHVV